MSLFSNCIRRGTRASQPAASAVVVGTLYHVTDETVTERSTGSAWESFSDAGAPAAAQYVTLATHASLSAERVLTAGNGVTLTDGGANGNATLKAPRVFGVEIDGGGATITTGVKGFWRAPYGGTITKATVLSVDASSTAGSIVIDVWKDTYANYPPTVADTITASAKPTLSSANKSEDSTLTGWTTSFSAGDVFAYKVDSATTVTKVLLLLEAA